MTLAPLASPAPRLLLAPNEFKGTLTARQAAGCLERGLARAIPEARFVLAPMADGGDGTARVVVEATTGTWHEAEVADPLGRTIRARFGITGDGRTAVVEMALASGLVLLTPGERNPWITTTRGTGDLIRAVLALGVPRILVGTGGSATNDGGTGMARALGARFLDAQGRDLPEGGGELGRLERIDLTGLDPRLAGTTIEVASDVGNPLYGLTGAAHVYAGQKGADAAMRAQLDAGLRHLAVVVRRDLGVEVERLPGAGTAGGLGAGLAAFLGARIQPGGGVVARLISLPEKLAECDLVLTGEGCLDGQTSFGKAPATVAQMARAAGRRVIAICGCLSEGAARSREYGLEACFCPVEKLPEGVSLKAAAPGRLERCAEQVGLLLRSGTTPR